MYKLNISRTCNGKPVWISKHYAIHLFVNGATRVWAMGPLKAGHCDLNAFYYVFAEGQCAQSPTCSGPGAKPRNGGWMSYNRKTKHWARGMGVTVTPVDLSNHMGIDRIIVDSGDANAFGVTEAVLNAVGTAMREWLHSSSAHPAVPAHAPVPSYTLSGDPIHTHNGEYILLPDAECSGLPVYKHTTSADYLYVIWSNRDVKWVLGPKQCSTLVYLQATGWCPDAPDNPGCSGTWLEYRRCPTRLGITDGITQKRFCDTTTIKVAPTSASQSRTWSPPARHIVESLFLESNSGGIQCITQSARVRWVLGNVDLQRVLPTIQLQVRTVRVVL